MLVGSKLLYLYDLLSPVRTAKFEENPSDADFIIDDYRVHDKGPNSDVIIHPDIHRLLYELNCKLRSGTRSKESAAVLRNRGSVGELRSVESVAVLMLTLKLSHMHYDLKNNSWHKHLHDIKHLFSLGYEPDEASLLLLKNEWTKFYKGKEKINLNKKPEDFFVADYNQSHDEIHLHFAFGSEPIYKKMLRDGSEVAVDFNKFYKLTEQEKLYSVIEESMVVAYERKLSLLNGFKHLYTNLSKGWWNDYITLNFKEVIEGIEEHSYIFKRKSKQLTK